MDSTLKQRLIGAAVLAALAIIFLPMLLKGPDVKVPDAAEVTLSMPPTPGQEFETRELPLTAPEGTAPPGGVLGMEPASAPATPVADTAAPALATQAPPVLEEDAVAAATAPAPAASAPAAAVAAGNYAVNIGSFGNLDNANALAAKLRAAGLPVSADRVKLASGTALRLRVGPYVDRAAAEAARLRSDTVTGTSSKVIALDADASASSPAPASVKIPPSAPTKPAKVVLPAASPGPVVAASPAKPVLASSGYAVQLSAPSVEADAVALRDRARGMGFSSFVQRVDTETGARFRVRVGPVADRAAAEAMRDAVNGKLGTKGIVVSNP